jgi:hypothetical protein
MRKIADEIENPVDAQLIRLCEKVCDAFHRTGHTPNMITTYSLFCGLLAIRAIGNEKAVLFAVWMTLSYFFDCLDGFMAREYDQVSVFGDYYDHAKDQLVTLGVFFMLFRYHKDSVCNRYALIFFALLFVGMVVHFGCQQHFVTTSDGQHAETLDYTKPLCRDPEYIRYTRFFGSGTFVLSLILFVVYIICKDNSKKDTT